MGYGYNIKLIIRQFNTQYFIYKFIGSMKN